MTSNNAPASRMNSLTVWLQTGLIGMLCLPVVMLMALHTTAYNQVRTGIAHASTRPESHKPTPLMPGQDYKKITAVQSEALSYSNALNELGSVRSQKMGLNEATLKKIEEWIQSHTADGSLADLGNAPLGQASEPNTSEISTHFAQAKELLPTISLGSTESFQVLELCNSFNPSQLRELFELVTARPPSANAKDFELHQEVAYVTSMCENFSSLRDAPYLQRLPDFLSKRPKALNHPQGIHLFCRIQKLTKSFGLQHVVMLMPNHPSAEKLHAMDCLYVQQPEFIPSIFRSFDTSESALIEVAKQIPDRALPALELAGACKVFPVRLTGWIKQLLESGDAYKVFYVRQLLGSELPFEAREQLFPVAAKRLVALKSNGLEDQLLYARDVERLTTPTNAASALNGALSIAKDKPLARTLLVSGALSQDPVRSLKSLGSSLKADDGLTPIPRDLSIIFSSMTDHGQPLGDKQQIAVIKYLEELRERTDRRMSAAIVLVPNLAADPDVVVALSKWGGKHTLAAIKSGVSHAGYGANTEPLEAAVKAIQQRIGQNNNGK